MSLSEYILLAGSSLFVIVDPLATVPAFLAMTPIDPPEQRIRLARPLAQPDRHEHHGPHHGPAAGGGGDSIHAQRGQGFEARLVRWPPLNRPAAEGSGSRDRILRCRINAAFRSQVERRVYAAE